MKISTAPFSRGRRLITLPLLLGFCFLLLPAAPSSAQGWPTLDSGGRSVERHPDLLEENRPKEAPALSLPPAPLPPTGGGETIFTGIMVQKITVKGSTAFTPQELATVTAPYLGRRLTMEDLELLRRKITLMYLEKGYVNSGAVIPDQTVTGGEVVIQVVEGRLTRINVEGNRWFTGGYLKDRIGLGAGVPLDVHSLQERLQLLQQDQRIGRIQAQLRPGEKPGEAELDVKVEEKGPFFTWFAVNNYQPPSVGAERGMATLAHQNLTGHGDVLSLSYGGSAGLNPLIDAWYALPINARDTTVMFRYKKNDFNVVDKVFGPLDIVSKSESFELSIRHPVYRSLSQELAISLSAEHERNRNTLSGEPFSFSLGEDNGSATVIPLRFTQEWTYRTQREVFAARSRMTFGLDVWDATQHQNGLPDGSFFAWLGQFQWARILGFLDTQLLVRADLQLSDKSLLPVEQFAVGGRYSVRGYRENALVRDQAFVTSLETRIPLLKNQRWADYLQLCPFFDYGYGFNRDLPDLGPNSIASAGIGGRWGASAHCWGIEFRPEMELYWGYAFRDLHLPNEDVQDNGIHFQVALTAAF